MGIINVCQPANCTGCEMCEQICNHGAITMMSDEEGFLRPVIDQTKCVKCGLCQRWCPVNTPLTTKAQKALAIYSGWSNNKNIRLESSSGGAFTEIAKLVISKGGVVFGVAMDKDMKARHISVVKEQNLSLLRGSKYVQSIIGDTYKEARQYLRDGKIVLFSGTSCQIAGLHNFLHKDYENLYTVDLICHGVPSPKVFNDYKSYIENLTKEPIRDIKFRCKKSSWIFFNMGINPHVEKNGDIKYSYIGNYFSDPYIRVFLRDHILRPSCYHCQYTSLHRISDFTIGDWWGYKVKGVVDKDFDKKGVSLIMCNTDKAVGLSQHLDMYLQKQTEEEALRTNISLRMPFPMPKTREKFWNEYRMKTFEKMIEKWMAPEKITLSKYIKVYHGNMRLIYKLLYFYERAIERARMKKFIIYIKAK